MSVLIAYDTVEGQTGKIARFVEEVARGAGAATTLFDTSDKSGECSFDGVDKVVVAGPVHERRHPKGFELFLSANKEALSKCKTLLLSVSLSAAFPEGNAEAQDYVDELKMRTEFSPDHEALVAGAVRTAQYDYYAAQVVRHVVLRNRHVDPAESEHEFTDWDVLEAKVLEFLGSTAA